MIKYNCMKTITLAELIALPPKYPKCAKQALVCIPCLWNKNLQKHKNLQDLGNGIQVQWFKFDLSEESFWIQLVIPQMSPDHADQLEYRSNFNFSNKSLQSRIQFYKSGDYVTHKRQNSSTMLPRSVRSLHGALWLNNNDISTFH